MSGKKKFIDINIDFDALKQMGKDAKDKVQEKIQDKIDQATSDKQTETKVESFTCPNCGSQMDIIEDRFHNRKLVCPGCKNSSRIYDSNKERIKREEANQKILDMQEAREHPVKHEIKKNYLIFGSVAIMLLLIFVPIGILSKDTSQSEQFTDVQEKVETEPTTEQTDKSSEKDDILTIDNCPELAAILTSHTDDDSTVIVFAEQYKDRIIKFDGCVRSISYHGDYKYRFDILVGYGDYNPDSAPGPAFQFQDVGAYDLGMGALDDVYSELPTGTNITITARIKEYNHNNLLFYLKPVLVEKR